MSDFHTKHEQHRGVWLPDTCEACRHQAPRDLYVVWNEKAGPPTRKYSRRWRADLEHRRLARRFPDGVFHVLKLKSTATASTPEGGAIVAVDYRGRWQLHDKRHKVLATICEPDCTHPAHE